ncbi:MAG: NYN domain-containing protein [Synergistaceae bacterium]|nr:NYN domain-containing protein [Synergistaceae bacterium]
MAVTDRKQIALLIDAENTSWRYIELILREISAYGFATYKRVYGNIEAVQSWRDVILKYAMTPIVQFNYTSGKNASDSALVIDAMDILYAGNVDGFCLVTSDSDFTKLAIRLRESGMLVIGMGEEKTPEPLMRACEEFKYLDMLQKEQGDVKEEGESGHDSENILPPRDKIEDEITRVINTVFPNEEWVRLADLGNTLPKEIPGFNTKHYGFSKLKKMFEAFGSRFEIREKSEGDSLPVLYVRERQ